MELNLIIILLSFLIGFTLNHRLKTIDHSIKDLILKTKDLIPKSKDSNIYIKSLDNELSDFKDLEHETKD